VRPEAAVAMRAYDSKVGAAIGDGLSDYRSGFAIFNRVAKRFPGFVGQVQPGEKLLHLVKLFGAELIRNGFVRAQKPFKGNVKGTDDMRGQVREKRAALFQCISGRRGQVAGE